MSTAAISANSFSQSNETYQFLQDFKQLGKDLSSGNLSAAQQDFVTLSQDVQSTSSTAPSASSTTSSASATGIPPAESPLVFDFQVLAQDLQSGNLSGAQQAFSQLQQTLQSGAVQQTFPEAGGHHDHGHRSGDSLSSLVRVLKTSLNNISSSSSPSSASSSTGTSSTTTSGTSSSTTSGTPSSTASGAPSSTSTGTSSTTTSGTPSATTSGTSTSSITSTSPLSQLGQDFQAIGAALQSGNLSAVQQAFAQFTQGLESIPSTQSSWGVGGYGYHQGYSAGAGFELEQAFLQSQSSDSTASTSTSTSAPASTSATTPTSAAASTPATASTLDVTA